MRTMWLKLTKKNKKLQMAYSKLKKKIFFLKIK